MRAITIYHSITDVNQNDWDLLAQDQVLMSHGWLQTIEQAYASTLSPTYLILYENSLPVAATAFRRIIAADSGNAFDHFLFGGLQPILTRLGVTSLPMIAPMPIKGYPVNFLVRPHSDPVKIQARMQALLSAIHEHSRNEKPPVAFTKVVREEKTTIRLLARNGYARMIAPPLAYMDIFWPSFSAYRRDRTRLSRNVRRKISWEINRNRKAGIEIVLLENPGGYEEALYRLMALNAAKHSRTDAFLNNQFLRLLKANMNDRYRIYAAFKKGSMIGMTIYLTHADVWHALFVGIDHHVDSNDLTYFNIASYRLIQDAINARCKRIYYGNSLYEFKVRRGCQLLPVNVYFKPCGWGRRVAAKPFFFFHRAWNRAKRPAVVREHLEA